MWGSMTAALDIPLFTVPITRPLPMDYDESVLSTDIIRAAQSGDEGAFNNIIMHYWKTALLTLVIFALGGVAGGPGTTFTPSPTASARSRKSSPDSTADPTRFPRAHR